MFAARAASMARLKATSPVLKTRGPWSRMIRTAPAASARHASSDSVRRRFELASESAYTVATTDAGCTGGRRRWRPNSRENASQTATPRTLLPSLSSLGEYTPIPSCPGKTATIPPETPLFAGIPTRKSHDPA